MPTHERRLGEPPARMVVLHRLDHVCLLLQLLVLEGKHADRTGVLLNIDNVEGVFSVSTPEGGNEMGIVPMQNLVKFNMAYDFN